LSVLASEVEELELAKSVAIAEAAAAAESLK
jgi:hypothetical protein